MKIAVIIPCRNENEFIEECIRAIYSCDLPKDSELRVFVVDGLSDDRTRDKIKELINEFKSLELIDNTKQLTPFAFNLGIHSWPDADFFQIVGARHIVSSNYFLNCINRLNEDKRIWCVGGKIINEYINETSKIISIAMSTSFGMGIGNFRTLNKSGFTDTVTSPMYPKFVFEKIGYFDEELVRNQDDDFNYRVEQAGGKIFFDADISLKYYVRGTYRGLWRQFFQYGYWKVYVNKKHKTLTTIRQLVPLLFVIYLILLPFSICFFKLLGLPLLVYLLMAKLISFQLSRKNKISVLKLIKTFFLLHVSYGLGYINGIWEFILLMKKPSNKQKSLSR